MTKRDFQEYICRPFCCFFRTGEKEELACRGALVVERLAERGVLDPSVLPAGDRKRPGICQENDALLEEMVCRRCPFRAEDCDYRAAERPHYAEPCGGYILLRILRETGVISAVDLTEVGDG